MNNKLNILTISATLILVLLFILVYLTILPLSKKEIRINSQPPNVHYKVEGIEGNTPAIIKLKAGKHQIELSADGYETLSESFSVRPFEKEVSVFYTLKEKIVRGDKPSPKAAATNYGGGANPDPQAEKEKATKLKEKYPFYAKLPASGSNYLINRPTSSDYFFIYIPKGSPEEGRVAVAAWFAENGISNIKTLKIIWLWR